MLHTSAQPPPRTRPGVFSAASCPQDQAHIAAPFDLRKDINIVSKPANFAFFNTTFPGNEGYSSDGFFLYIYHDAPPQPPPRSFAGVPVIFVDPRTRPFPAPAPSPFPHGFFVRSLQGAIATHLNYREDYLLDWSPLFNVIRDHFEHIKVPISEVIYWRCLVQIVLGDEHTDRERLPYKAAGLTCSYLFEKDMQRPEQCAKNPKQGMPDNTAYDVLRPGVRVSSDYVPGTSSFYSTTLGTRVRNKDGRHFITVAAHGFPDQCGTTVYSGLTDCGRIAGEVVGRIGNTDVALMRPARDQRFSDEAFGTEKDNEPQVVRGLRQPQFYDLVHLNLPGPGLFDGQVMNCALRKMPKDADVGEQEWVAVNWIYPGVDATQFPPDSMRGAVAYGEDGKVLSFIQYVFTEGPWKGWCVGTSAVELIARGYS